MSRTVYKFIDNERLHYDWESVDLRSHIVWHIQIPQRLRQYAIPEPVRRMIKHCTQCTLCQCMVSARPYEDSCRVTAEYTVLANGCPDNNIISLLSTISVIAKKY